MDKTMLKKFFYWMNERHSIYLKKEAGEPWPWTKDKILQEYKFTNVFRQNDAVTKKLTKVLKGDKDVYRVFKKIIIFRMFNWPPTYYRIAEAEVMTNHNFINDWGRSYCKNMMKLLTNYSKEGNKVFTGAYIITNNGRKEPKIQLVCEAIDAIVKNHTQITDDIYKNKSIEYAVKRLSEYPMVGKFVGYELATDLRHTNILNKAKDINTWANPGPGAKRGLNRIYKRELKYSQKDQLFIDEMRCLLSHAVMEMDPEFNVLLTSLVDDGRTLEMRDIEHSLCEFDKYMRVKNGEGRPRSKYRVAK